VLYSCGESDCEVEVLNFSETSISLSHQLLPSVLTWQHGQTQFVPVRCDLCLFIATASRLRFVVLCS